MTTEQSTISLVGTTGGAGTTRLAVDVAATLARDGRTVAVLDAAFATQGLARYVSGRIDPDLTTLLTDEDYALTDGRYDLPLDVPGNVACWPAHTPFERLARSKSPAAAQRLERLIEHAGRTFDHVVVDTPPIAANQSIAAVLATAHVALVAPATYRGSDGVAIMRDRLSDLGAGADLVVANGSLDHPVSSADVSIPDGPSMARETAPTVLDPDEAYAPAVATLTERLINESLDLEFAEEGLLDAVTERVTDSLS
jgi:cellulose biosynthesis protein BcsQ